MTKNAINVILRVANECLLLSFGILILMSFIDVVPSKQSSFELIFYSVAMIFTISLSISICTRIVRKVSSANNLSRFAKPQIMFFAIVALAAVFASPIAMLFYRDCFKGQTIIPLTEFALCKIPFALLLLCVAITLFDLRGFKFLKVLSYSLFLLVCFLYLLGIILPFRDFLIEDCSKNDTLNEKRNQLWLLNARSLDDSYFSLWLGRKGYLHLEWSDIPANTKDIIISWLPTMCEKAYPSIVSYAPGLIIHAKGFEVNFIGDMTVINYDSRFGTRNNRVQIARKATKVEEEIKLEISKLIVERGVETPPLSNRQKWLTHLKRDSSCKNRESTYGNLFSFHNPLTVLKCRRSVSPEKRVVLDKQVLPEMIATTFEELMKTGRKARLTYVCCEYYLKTPDGETVGILTDDKTQIVQGFDIGRRSDAIDIHSRAMHEIILLDDEENQRKAYFLLVGTFQKNSREAP